MFVCRLRDGNPFGALPAFWAAPCASDRFQYRAGDAGAPFDGASFDGADSDGRRGSARVSGGGAGSERWSVRGDRGAGRERPARDGVRMSGAGYAGAAVGGCGDRSSGRAGQEAGRCRRGIGRAGGGSGAWPVGRRSDGCGTLRAAGSRTGGGAIRALRNRAVGRAGVGGISGRFGAGVAEKGYGPIRRSVGEPERRAKA